MCPAKDEIFDLRKTAADQPRGIQQVSLGRRMYFAPRVVEHAVQ